MSYSNCVKPTFMGCFYLKVFFWKSRQHFRYSPWGQGLQVFTLTGFDSRVETTFIYIFFIKAYIHGLLPTPTLFKPTFMGRAVWFIWQKVFLEPNFISFPLARKTRGTWGESWLSPHLYFSKFLKVNLNLSRVKNFIMRFTKTYFLYKRSSLLFYDNFDIS